MSEACNRAKERIMTFHAFAMSIAGAVGGLCLYEGIQGVVNKIARSDVMSDDDPVVTAVEYAVVAGFAVLFLAVDWYNHRDDVKKKALEGVDSVIDCLTDAENPRYVYEAKAKQSIPLNVDLVGERKVAEQSGGESKDEAGEGSVVEIQIAPDLDSSLKQEIYTLASEIKAKLTTIYDIKSADKTIALECISKAAMSFEKARSIGNKQVDKKYNQVRCSRRLNCNPDYTVLSDISLDQTIMVGEDQTEITIQTRLLTLLKDALEALKAAINNPAAVNRAEQMTAVNEAALPSLGRPWGTRLLTCFRSNPVSGPATDNASTPLVTNRRGGV
ncbi:MAG: hypothetical protein P1U34_04165 [Coxiellaceae bacterium]|nr:hypothetical protein [Coxiellaceae bacterium]